LTIRVKRLACQRLTEPIGQLPDTWLTGGHVLMAVMRCLVIAASRCRIRSEYVRSCFKMGCTVLVCLAQAACTVGPKWSRPSAFSPSSWFASSKAPVKPIASEPVPEPIDPKWWDLFGDPELTSLESRVAAANLNVRLATVRLLESRSQRQITGADQFPTLQGDGSYTREKVSQKGVLGLIGGSSGSSGGGSFSSMGSSANGTTGRSGGIPSTVTGGQNVPPFNLWQYGFDASWELDLWGRVRREVESADASVEASADARRNSLLSVLAEVARDYLQLRGIQTQLAITHENIGTEQQSLALSRDRARAGLTTDLDVANAAAQLQSTTAQLPQLEQQQAETINALSFLLGEAPGALQAELVVAKPVPPVPPRVPVGVPSELARRRPDIRQAEAQLHSATADIGVAVADFYPKITLDGSIGLQALKFKDLGNWAARQYGLGPSISLPIFEGGRLRATLALRRVEQQEAAVNYEQTVLQAWHDVDNALTAYAAEQRRRDALQEAVLQNRRAVDLSQQRYKQGVEDFFNVLDAERSLLAAQLQLADSTTTVSQNLVQLYKALGGGWEKDYPVITASK
jgi:NodT family efflux transporter outer membrane factor (OMF) lipoprotein